MGRKGKEGAKGRGGGGGRGEKKAAAEPALQLITTTSLDLNEAQDPFELLDTCVAELEDRRGATREKAMAALGRALEALPPLDELDSRCLTILALCGVSIKKGPSGNAKEARLAYRAVGLLALTLRAGARSLLAEAFPTLSKMLRVQASRDDAPTLVAAIECLAAVTFAGAVDAEDVELSMNAIWAVIFPPDARSTEPSPRKTAKVLVAAVSAWTFLVTIMPAELKMDGAAWNATAASLAELLENDDRTVRMAAGEALAVFVELNLTQYFPHMEMEALVDWARDLAVEAGGQGVNKAMLHEQRHLFRQIVAFLDHDERPEESVTVRSLLDRRQEVLKVSTWEKRVQLYFLRRFLGGGFLKHVQDNELFKEAFSFGVEEGKSLSIAKKKEMSKNRDKSRHVRRDLRWDWE